MSLNSNTLSARSAVLCESCKALASPSVDKSVHPPAEEDSSLWSYSHFSPEPCPCTAVPHAAFARCNALGRPENSSEIFFLLVFLFIFFARERHVRHACHLAPGQQQTAPNRIHNSQSCMSPLSFFCVHSEHCGRMGSVFLRFLQVEN